MKPNPVYLIAAVVVMGCTRPAERRSTISLNGDWQLAVTAVTDVLPGEYDKVVPVPGLVDLAIPSFDTVATADKIYWYKRSFLSPDRNQAICRLKINKAKYHTRLYLNGQFVGENPYCFTPGEFDIAGVLNPPGESNDIVIAVGCRNNLPPNVTDGNDFEKDFYYPGIYDDVKLIFSAAPYITRVQCAPEIELENLRIRVEFLNGAGPQTFRLKYEVSELLTGKKITSGSRKVSGSVADFEIVMQDCHPWTPEDPFLYRLVLNTSSDEYSTRFGMRSFSFDPDQKVALLNGDPYYLRGTNVCIYRFFDDPARVEQPWNPEWILNLHQQFKSMHWNAIRYCIGFPPERWYEIADSLGFLIADEFPLWYGNNPLIVDSLDKQITASDLAKEYGSWMRERWNHPCVVIWDAQNESVTELTGNAIGLVRDLDLSDRPWENGWAPPQAKTDPIESHPYLYTHYFTHRFDPPVEQMLKYFFDTIRIPRNDANERSPAADGAPYENPVLINEYGWLWLNRDGSPTRLTGPIYDNAFGTDLTTKERFELYARHLAIMTEYWRAHRTAAGVQHFCGLGYSRPDEPRGETSDHFTDIDNLVFEPHFEKYVKPAFSPVGLMLAVWDHSYPAGSKLDKSLFLINDLQDPWNGTVKVFFDKDGEQREAVTLDRSLKGYECREIEFSCTAPSDPGTYDMIAEIQLDGIPVKSVRQIRVE